MPQNTQDLKEMGKKKSKAKTAAAVAAPVEEPQAVLATPPPPAAPSPEKEQDSPTTREDDEEGLVVVSNKDSPQNTATGAANAEAAPQEEEVTVSDVDEDKSNKEETTQSSAPPAPVEENKVDEEGANNNGETAASPPATEEEEEEEQGLFPEIAPSTAAVSTPEEKTQTEILNYTLISSAFQSSSIPAHFFAAANGQDDSESEEEGVNEQEAFEFLVQEETTESLVRRTRIAVALKACAELMASKQVSTANARNVLKEKILDENEEVIRAVKVYELDHNVNDLLIALKQQAK